MTENRFRVSDVILLTKPNTICDGDIFLNQKEVCDLLNKLHEENEYLKIDKKNWYIQESQTRVEIHKLKKDNEQLKQEIMDLGTAHAEEIDKIEDEFDEEILKLEKENEQLKKEKENWKSSACNNSSFNSILINELSIAQEQGYEVSDPFKKLMEDKGDDE